MASLQDYFRRQMQEMQQQAPQQYSNQDMWRDIMGGLKGQLAAGAPSRTPVGFGERLAGGLEGAETSRQQYEKKMLEEAMMDLKLREMSRPKVPEGYAYDEFTGKAKKIPGLENWQPTSFGSTPAALQLANEYSAARKSGNTQRMQDIEMFAKTLERGQGLSSDGAIVPRMGAPEAAGMMKYGETAGGERAKLAYAGDIEAAKVTGKDEGEKTNLLRSSESKLPQLEAAVDKLSELGKTATFTYPGQAADFLVRQTTGNVDKRAIARSEYISRIDNEILPLLRDTFGAQFTQKEGEALKATLGDPDASPAEKDAVLRSFIETKKASIGTLRKELGVEEEYLSDPGFQEFLRARGVQ